MRQLTILLLAIGLSLNSVAQVSIESVQAKIDSLQIYAKESYEIIEEYTTKDGDLEILSAVLFCGKSKCLCQDRSSFQRRYGLRRADGEMLVPVFNGIKKWGDNYIVYYDCSVMDDDIRYDRWMAILDHDFIVLDVFECADIIDYWFVVKKDGKYGVISHSMRVSIPCIYDQLTDFSLFDEYSYYDEYAEMEMNYKAMAAQKDGKWGIITLAGSSPVDFKYDFLTNMDKGKAVAKLNNKWGIINGDDEVMLPFEYDSIQRKGDSYILKKGEKYGMVDYQIKVEDAEFVYDEIKQLCHWSTFGKKGNRWYNLDERYYDSEGYSDVKRLGRWEYFAVKQNKKWAVMKCGGTIETDFIYTGFKGVTTERKEEHNADGGLIRIYPVYHVTMLQGRKEIVLTFED